MNVIGRRFCHEDKVTKIYVSDAVLLNCVSLDSPCP